MWNSWKVLSNFVSLRTFAKLFYNVASTSARCHKVDTTLFPFHVQSRICYAFCSNEKSWLTPWNYFVLINDITLILHAIYMISVYYSYPVEVIRFLRTFSLVFQKELVNTYISFALLFALKLLNLLISRWPCNIFPFSWPFWMNHQSISRKTKTANIYRLLILKQHRIAQRSVPKNTLIYPSSLFFSLSLINEQKSQHGSELWRILSH